MEPISQWHRLGRRLLSSLQALRESLCGGTSTGWSLHFLSHQILGVVSYFLASSCRHFRKWKEKFLKNLKYVFFFRTGVSCTVGDEIVTSVRRHTVVQDLLRSQANFRSRRHWSSSFCFFKKHGFEDYCLFLF
ncbi:hypothetical protein CEXT_168491 [Caerostris extrusa]|uniref:Uncharacterized protein n=1 Tax=Caerostris extrusa TaxID=172846 RepID=A0AAV4PJM9_CAEEX|nr:hypothetical protein CEXT_168491 [Caerostris extrusa]